MGLPMPIDARQALKDLIDAGATIGQIVAFTVVLDAADGHAESRAFVADRTEGSPTFRQELTGADGGPIQVKAVDYRTSIAALAPRPMGDSTAPSEDKSFVDGPALGKDRAG